jgi:uncharacterized protein (TIGR02246 family)
MVLILCILCVISCNRYSKEYNTDLENPMLKSIEELHKKDKQAALNGDIKTLSSLFTDDGILIPAVGDIIEGKEGLKNMLKQSFELYKDYTVTEYDHDFKEIKVLGQYAYEWGIYSSKYKSKKDSKEITASGKLMRILKLQADGSWKVHRTIWTVDK